MTWDAVLDAIAKRLPPDLLERPPMWLESRLAAESQVTTALAGRTVTFYSGDGPPVVVLEPDPFVELATGNWWKPWERLTVDPTERIFPTAAPDAMDATDILNELWIRLLAELGRVRGVVDPACFRGLREHGYVARVDR